MVILDRSGLEAANVFHLKDHLLLARQIGEQLQRQIDSSTDAQITILHGIPAEDVAAYKTVIANVVTNLLSEPVETLLGNVA